MVSAAWSVVAAPRASATPTCINSTPMWRRDNRRSEVAPGAALKAGALVEAAGAPRLRRYGRRQPNGQVSVADAVVLGRHPGGSVTGQLPSARTVEAT